MPEFIFIPLCLVGFVVLLFIIYNNNAIIKRYKISSKKIKTPLRIVLLSDFHNKRYSKGGQKLVKKIAAQKPDMIFITGDTVDRRRPDFNVSREFVKNVSKICETYLITGNHERALGRESCIEQLDCKDILLDDDYRIFEEYSVLGLSDTVGLSDSTWQSDALCVFERLENYKIVAVHRPSQFENYLGISERDVDLVLCGHIHGGVMRIPFFGAVFSPDEGFFPKYSKGVYVKNGTTLVISGGLGNTAFPLRINNFPEIVVIDIEQKN